jgi:hypothetical protein
LKDNQKRIEVIKMDDTKKQEGMNEEAGYTSRDQTQGQQGQKGGQAAQQQEDETLTGDSTAFEAEAE